MYIHIHTPSVHAVSPGRVTFIIQTDTFSLRVRGFINTYAETTGIY